MVVAVYYHLLLPDQGLQALLLHSDLLTGVSSRVFPATVLTSHLHVPPRPHFSQVVLDKLL